MSDERVNVLSKKNYPASVILKLESMILNAKAILIFENKRIPLNWRINDKKST